MSKIKTFRNIAVVSMATAVGLGVVGGVAGTVAWYQYSTRSTTSIIGTAVADTGVIQVSKSGNDGTWVRDLVTDDLLEGRADAKLTPVTFGALNDNGSLPAKAYKRADASANMDATNPGSYDEVYLEANSAKDYIQYSFYLKAEQEGQKVALPVYLSDILLENFGSVSNANFYKSLRVHLAIDENNDSTVEKYFLLSSEGETIALFGQLDLDGDHVADKVGGYEGNANRDDEVVYGNVGEFQKALAANSLKAARGADGNFDAEPREKVVLNTREDAISKVTVTIWIEGWDSNIGTETIEVEAPEYRRAESLYGEKLDGKNLYLVDNLGNYVLQASGRALDKEYFSLKPEVKIEHDSSEPSESVAGLYRLNGTTFEPASGMSVADVKYYELNPEAASLLKKDVADTTSVEDKYVFDGADYVLCDSADDTDLNYNKFDSAKDYFELVSSEVYQDANVVDVDDFDARKADLFVFDGNDYAAVDPADSYDDALTYYVFVRNELDVPVWNEAATINDQQFRFGLTFDVGADAFAK